MKHSSKKGLFGFKENILSLLKQNNRVSFQVESTSIISFILSVFDFQKVILSKNNDFDDILSSFGVFPKNVVGFPYLKQFNRQDYVVKSHHQEMFENASVMFSSNIEEIKTCVVDERVLDVPSLYKKKSQNILVGHKGVDQETLVDFLIVNKYEKVDAVSCPGEYVIRGGIIDIFSFGIAFPFRLGFLSETTQVMFFDQSSGDILRKEKSVLIYPEPQKRKLSIKDCIDGFIIISYKNKTLTMENLKCKNSNSINSNDFFETLSYQKYLKRSKEKASVVFSPHLLSEGCYFNNTFFLPSWFANKKEGSAPERVPLSGSLHVGDFYVHESFGVCKYLGFSPGYEEGEKITLLFDDGKILLDVKYLDKISFFAPKSVEEMQLDSMNKIGKWKRKKQKSYDKAHEFVESMVDAYAQRDVHINKGLDFDEELFAMFLSSFPYVDTQDQSSAWGSIKKDLCSDKPMHRLLCGDVGFGKTEIAMRASFLICLNSKQVLVLAPTTILCEQLFSCFKERFSAFGVKTERISRLTKKNNQNISLFLDKKLDILIGTHAILKNDQLLGRASLIVVDEEHRFGVKDKEKILEFSPGCHFLSMSATPIPRSLQLSLSGVRNISTLLTAPMSRKPIITNVLYFSKQLIKTIILSEVSRNGQVYIVDNSVNNVKSVSSLISSFFPDFSISFLHGSLDKKTINNTMSMFRLKKINILISTVIIESGIDIPSANTIIINNAHMFGLSQLHQLRGRVGRSNVQSYAYMLIPKTKKITKDGISRLKSIKKHSSLGAGYSLAVEDLQIRGAGSLFGYSQSGQSFVGFEYYSKLLSRAMKNIKYRGLDFKPAEISLGSFYIPESFIPIDEERAFYYKSIFECLDLDSLGILLSKTVKLFGSIPESFLLLFKTKELSLFCEPTPIVSIVKKESTFIITCSALGLVDISTFISKVDVFFIKNTISYTLKPDSNLLKIQFKYIGEDCYILLEDFIKKLYD